ncbi:hypothetical protein [Flindersiella endophytica]
MTARPDDRRPLKVTYEILVVRGEEAKLLRRRQADAIRALLVWLTEEEDGGSTAA